MREYQVRICERLGMKFPGPTRHRPSLPSAVWATCDTARAGLLPVAGKNAARGRLCAGEGFPLFP